MAKAKAKQVETLPPVVNTPVLSRLTTNDLQNQYYLERIQWLQRAMDPRRDFNKECGYPDFINPRLYRLMYDREGIAKRFNDIYPDECFSVEPEIYETEDDRDMTDLEQGWLDLTTNEQTNPLHYFHRIDVMSGIERYGALLYGLDDGLPLNQPVRGIGEDGLPDGSSPSHNLLYLRCFDEITAPITKFQTDRNNPRYSQPLEYSMHFSNFGFNQGMGGSTAAGSETVQQTVHWSRVQHVADNRQNSNIFGVPRMQPVYNRLCDVHKILGGSAEMFWKGGFPGFSFELDPALVAAGVTIDTDSLKQQFYAFSNSLQRYISLVGLNAKSLAPQVADPEGHLNSQLLAIALAGGIPLRIFLGSEQGQLASGQDVRTWNRRLMKRQTTYLTPMLIRPFIDRMIMFGVLAPPAKKSYLDVIRGKKPQTSNGMGYKVHWPDVNIPDRNENSQIADRMANTMQKYVTGGVAQAYPLRPWLTMVMGLTPDQADFVIAEAKKPPDVKIVPPALEQAKAKAVATPGASRSGSPKGQVKKKKVRTKVSDSSAKSGSNRGVPKAGSSKR